MTMEILAWVASVLVFACFFMKTMIPLRGLAIASNLAFIGYAALGVHEGIFFKVLPILLLHVALLPLNIVRLLEVRGLTQAVRTMQKSDLPYDFMIPFMSPVHFQAGFNIFKKDEPASDVYVIKTGSILLPEVGKLLGPGVLFGEVAIFSRDAVRTATATCKTDCELLRISGTRILELFYQDRQFSFKIARLLAGYA
jgi:CRP/FNR family cyclic AMP-dependent transcriptional regulator